MVRKFQMTSLSIICSWKYSFFLESLESQNARIALIESCKAEFGGDFQTTGKNSSNQFSFIERANQSMIDETDDREIQTDPPPM